VMAGHPRRRARTTGGIQQLMSRDGSLLWRADWFAACSSRGDRRTPVRRSWPLAGSPALRTRPVAEARRSALLIVLGSSDADVAPGLCEPYASSIRAAGPLGRPESCPRRPSVSARC
jgi:hypothetical protein